MAALLSIHYISKNKIIIFKSLYYGIFCIFLILAGEVLSADTNSIKVEGWVNIQDKKFYPYQSSLRNKMKSAVGIQLKSKTKGFSSNFTFSINSENKILFDETHLNYRSKNITFGLGKISRQWSFSPNTSLILSKNARPTASAYVIINDFENKKNKSQSMLDAWSIEFFNSLLKGSNNPNKSMQLGTRILYSPINNLDFELVKVSQWGGEGYNNGPSAFKAAFLGDSKFIILDEPSSGIDSYSRRQIWNIIKENKNDKIILLTTHFMDEAEYLGDRIGILKEG